MILRTQLFAKGKSLKSEGIGMPRDKNKGLHGDLSGPCRTNMINDTSCNLLELSTQTGQS
jgi:hypothetical protein